MFMLQPNDDDDVQTVIDRQLNADFDRSTCSALVMKISSARFAISIR